MHVCVCVTQDGLPGARLLIKEFDHRLRVEVLVRGACFHELLEARTTMRRVVTASTSVYCGNVLPANATEVIDLSIYDSR